MLRLLDAQKDKPFRLTFAGYWTFRTTTPGPTSGKSYPGCTWNLCKQLPGSWERMSIIWFLSKMPPQVRKLMNYTFLMQSWIHLLAYYHKWVQIFIWRKNCFLQGWTQFWELSRGRLGTRYWQQRTHTTRWEIPAAGLFKCSQVRLMSLRSCNVISSISICTNFYISKHWIHETVSHLSRYYATVPFLK